MYRFLNVRYLIPLFFIGAFFLGLNLFNDYGTHWDTHLCFYRGSITYNYLVELIADEMHKFDSHGWIFDAFVYTFERALGLSETSDLLRIKYLFTYFLFLISIYFFIS